MVFLQTIRAGPHGDVTYAKLQRVAGMSFSMLQSYKQKLQRMGIIEDDRVSDFPALTPKGHRYLAVLEQLQALEDDKGPGVTDQYLSSVARYSTAMPLR